MLIFLTYTHEYEFSEKITTRPNVLFSETDSIHVAPLSSKFSENVQYWETDYNDFSQEKIVFRNEHNPVIFPQ